MGIPCCRALHPSVLYVAENASVGKASVRAGVIAGAAAVSSAEI